MDKNLKDILSHLDPEIDQETLLRYLQGRLSADEQHELEKGMMSNEFDADALEGLEHFRDRKDLGLVVDQLNSELRKRMRKKKLMRKNRQLSLDPWLIIALITILLLVVISYVIIHMITQH